MSSCCRIDGSRKRHRAAHPSAMPYTLGCHAQGCRLTLQALPQYITVCTLLPANSGENGSLHLPIYHRTCSQRSPTAVAGFAHPLNKKDQRLVNAFGLQRTLACLARRSSAGEAPEGQCKVIDCHRYLATLANHRPAFFMHQAFQDAGRPLIGPTARQVPAPALQGGYSVFQPPPSIFPQLPSAKAAVRR